MRKKKLFHTKRIKGKGNVPAAVAAGVVFCLVVYVLVVIVPGLHQAQEPVIVLTPEAATIRQGEPLPEFRAKAVLKAGTKESEKKTWLSKQAGYRIEDLLRDLNAGEDYEIDCDADGTKAGEFPMRVRLSGELKSSLESEWKGKVGIQIQPSTLTVEEEDAEASDGEQDMGTDLR